ncbi:hypothetical protein BDR07DRAFT_358398 [Suillus spraguei]|nr:hypothetical protein BDR07DRAFT_358398 [Suillus spraguei]
MGDHIKLTWFIAENKDELLEAYLCLMLAQKCAYNAEVPKARIQKNHVTQANLKALFHSASFLVPYGIWPGETAAESQT